MAVYVYIVDTKKLKIKEKKNIVKVLNATEYDKQLLLIKPIDFDNNTEIVFKYRDKLEVGLGDIQSGRLDIKLSPSPIFSEKFDLMMREVNDER